MVDDDVAVVGCHVKVLLLAVCRPRRQCGRRAPPLIKRRARPCNDNLILLFQRFARRQPS
nr:hypothetical protein RVX_0068 [Nitratidesulfovibrio sp. HK-II]